MPLGFNLIVMPADAYRPHQLIKDAAKHGELVVFVGAGTSVLCGSPNWQGFANQVVDALEKNGGLSFLEGEQLRTLGDPRRTLSIAMALAKEGNVSLDFEGILHPSKPAAIGAELYELLSSLRPVFVTTNYDRWLDEEGPEIATGAPTIEESEPTRGPNNRPRYYLKDHLTSDRLAERGAVIHLHGSCADPNSMVVSLKDYIEHYADHKVQNFLSEMFRSYMDFPRFCRHISTSSLKLLKRPWAQLVEVTVPADSIVKPLDIFKHI